MRWGSLPSFDNYIILQARLYSKSLKKLGISGNFEKETKVHKKFVKDSRNQALKNKS